MGEVIFKNNRAFVTDERWVTIGGEDNDGSGQHVLIKENGTIAAGFGKGRNVKNAFGGGKADTPEKANETVKQKAFKEATARVTKRRSKEESAKIERAKETLKDIDKRIAEAKADGDGKRVSFLEATKNSAKKAIREEMHKKLEKLNNNPNNLNVSKLKEAGKIRPLDERKDLVPRHIAKAYKEIDKKSKEYNDERKALIKESKNRLDKILKTEGEGDAFYKAYKEEKRKLYNLDRKYDREAGKLEKESGFTQWSTTPNHKVQFNTKTGNAHVKMKRRTISLKK